MGLRQRWGKTAWGGQQREGQCRKGRRDLPRRGDAMGLMTGVVPQVQTFTHTYGQSITCPAPAKSGSAKASS